MQHFRLVFGTLIIAFGGAMASQHVVLVWLGAHPWYDALIASAGVAFHAYNTYATPTQKAS